MSAGVNLIGPVQVFETGLDSVQQCLCIDSGQIKS